MKNFPKDKNENTVLIGDIVKIVRLDEEFIECFEPEYQPLISSMIGQYFKIVGYDELGQPCVAREWHDELGQLQSHLIALDKDDMEKCI